MSGKEKFSYDGLGFETKQVWAGQEMPDSDTGARAVPVYQTTSFVFKDCEDASNRFELSAAGNIYTRITNPTLDIFEKRMAALEGGIAALSLASGSAAVYYSVLNLAKAGDNIVSANTIYGGTYNLFAHTLKEYGIKTSFVNPDNLDEFKNAIDERTRCIFIETLGNPNSNLIDIEKIAAIAHENNIPLIVDNTFATPYLLRPFEYGADIVVHSATKFIGGHGNSLGGVIVDGGKFDWKKSGKFPSLVEPSDSYHGLSFTKAFGAAAFIARARTVILRDTGAALSPFNAFLLLQGAETLSLRVERHVENALKIVEFLSEHDKIANVNHPSLPGSRYKALYNKYFPKGAGSIFTIEVKGGEKEAKKFVDNLKIFSLLANVADAKSLVIHPASTTHSQMSVLEQAACGIKPSTVRLSVGIENVNDLIWDLGNALKTV